MLRNVSFQEEEKQGLCILLIKPFLLQPIAVNPQETSSFGNMEDKKDKRWSL